MCVQVDRRGLVAHYLFPPTPSPAGEHLPGRVWGGRQFTHLFDDSSRATLPPDSKASPSYSYSPLPLPPPPRPPSAPPQHVLRSASASRVAAATRRAPPPPCPRGLFALLASRRVAPVGVRLEGGPSSWADAHHPEHVAHGKYLPGQWSLARSASSCAAGLLQRQRLWRLRCLTLGMHDSARRLHKLVEHAEHTAVEESSNTH